ncbi:hypothetical protein BGW80DRAFT_1352401 [Lactifluus volemus]|nr:hypothetical protein BGW80DRAFT_1352401 [Lactifluus volemus]
MHDLAKEILDFAERELTIANHVRQQAKGAHKQTMADLQRARSSLQALRATHVAELKNRDKDIEAIRECWSKLADLQLKIAKFPSGISTQPANALALGDEDGKAAPDENVEPRALVVDTANTVNKILHKMVSADPDDLEVPAPLATVDLFPLGAPDTAFERLSALLTSLHDALTILKGWF